MEKYFSIPEIAKLLNLEYTNVYDQLKKHNVCIIRLPGKRVIQLYVSRIDLATFLLTVDWVMIAQCTGFHPFAVDRIVFEQLYIHRSAIAQQLCYKPRYIVNLSVNQGFPKVAIRNGWYQRAAVLRWLQLNRPMIYQRINGTLS